MYIRIAGSVRSRRAAPSSTPRPPQRRAAPAWTSHDDALAKHVDRLWSALSSAIPLCSGPVDPCPELMSLCAY